MKKPRQWVIEQFTGPPWEPHDGSYSKEWWMVDNYRMMFCGIRQRGVSLTSRHVMLPVPLHIAIRWAQKLHSMMPATTYRLRNINTDEVIPAEVL